MCGNLRHTRHCLFNIRYIEWAGSSQFHLTTFLLTTTVHERSLINEIGFPKIVVVIEST